MKKVIMMVPMLFLLLFAGCSPSREIINSSITETSIRPVEEQIVFAKLPSPPQCKKSKDAKVIKKFIQYIENAEKTPISDYDDNGWYMRITISTQEGVQNFTLVNNTLSINGAHYRVANSFLTDMEKIYTDINANEESYTSSN